MTPKLTTWSGHLTPDGEALAAWLAAQDMPIPRPAKPTLLPPAAVYFREQPARAAELWAMYEASREPEAVG